MADQSPLPPLRRAWTLLIGVVMPVWLAMFLVRLVHVDLPLMTVVAPDTLDLFGVLMLWLVPVFVVNLILQWRWSGLAFARFFRQRWLDFLMIIPVLRVLQFARVFQAGRAARVLFQLSRARNLFGLGRRIKRLGANALRRVRAPAVALQEGVVRPGEVVDESG